jgi:hypothetical protein
MSVKRVYGVLEPGDCSEVETKRGVSAEFRFDLICAGWPGRAAEDVIDPAALLASVVEHHDHLSLEALRECGCPQR